MEYLAKPQLISTFPVPTDTGELQNDYELFEKI